MTANRVDLYHIKCKHFRTDWQVTTYLGDPSNQNDFRFDKITMTRVDVAYDNNIATKATKLIVNYPEIRPSFIEYSNYLYQGT
jgi:hypothetical protein